MPTEEKIRELAHSLWEREGRPEGKDMDHYLAAKQILEKKEAAQNPARAHRTTASKSAKARTHSSRAKKG